MAPILFRSAPGPRRSTTPNGTRADEPKKRDDRKSHATPLATMKKRPIKMASAGHLVFLGAHAQYTRLTEKCPTTHPTCKRPPEGPKTKGSSRVPRRPVRCWSTEVPHRRAAVWWLALNPLPMFAERAQRNQDGPERAAERVRSISFCKHRYYEREVNCIPFFNARSQVSELAKNL